MLRNEDLPAAHATPKVSVIIPTRDRPKFLARALDSVAAQTFRDFEVIVVDDASGQSPIRTVRRIEQARLIRHDEPLGGSAARNTGIRAARGAYVALLDDDDAWKPNKLAEQVRVLDGTGPNVALCYTWIEVFDHRAGRVVWQSTDAHQGHVLKELLRENFISMISVLIKREVFECVGLFDESFPSCQDWEMWVRIAGDYDFLCVPNVLARAYHHETSRIGTSPVALRGYEKFVERFASLYRGREHALAGHLESIGYAHLRNGDHRRAARYLRHSIGTWPWSWKCWAKWCCARCRMAAGGKADDRRRAA